MNALPSSFLVALTLALGCSAAPNDKPRLKSASDLDTAIEAAVQTAVQYVSNEFKPSLLNSFQTEKCLQVRFESGTDGFWVEVLVSLETGQFLKSSYMPEARK